MTPSEHIRRLAEMDLSPEQAKAVLAMIADTLAAEEARRADTRARVRLHRQRIRDQKRIAQGLPPILEASKSLISQGSCNVTRPSGEAQEAKSLKNNEMRNVTPPAPRAKSLQNNETCNVTGLLPALPLEQKDPTTQKTQTPSQPSKNPPTGVKKVSGSPRGTRLTEDWQPDESGKALARELLVDPKRCWRELEDFRDYWIALPGQRGLKLDWQRTWKKWVRTAADRGGQTSGRAPHSGELRGKDAMVKLMKENLDAIGSGPGAGAGRDEPARGDDAPGAPLLGHSPQRPHQNGRPSVLDYARGLARADDA